MDARLGGVGTSDEQQQQHGDGDDTHLAIVMSIQRVHLCGAEPGTRAERFYSEAGWKRVGMAPGGEIRFELKRA
jgi:hypothetical protein